MLKQFFALLISLIFIPLYSAVNSTPARSMDLTETQVESVVIADNGLDTQTGVLTARIEHLLSLNRIFDNGFNNPREIIEEVEIQLLDLAETDDFGQKYIKQEYVLGFIRHLYGIDIDPSAGMYDYLPAPDGYFAIPAKGYSLISHKNIEYTVLPNGDIDVNSVMTIDCHDDEPFDVEVNTLLRPNSQSEFGFNIISANISE